MKHLENFENFNEGKFSNFAAGAAIVGATLWGANTLMNPVTKATAEYRETELVDFPEFFVRTIGTDDNINVSINGDVIGCSFHQGKYNRYTITVEEGTNNVYYKLSTFGVYIYATTNKSNLPFNNSNSINLSELEVIEENSEYKILRVPGVFSGLDFILINKGYNNPKNEFEMNGEKYTYFDKRFGFIEGHASFVVKCK